METLEFIAVLLTPAIIVSWYLYNENIRSDGDKGLLALQADPTAPTPAAERRLYKMKTRLAQAPRAKSDVEGAKALAAGTTPGFRHEQYAARMRRKFRRQDEARYRVKDRRPKTPDTP